MVLKHDRPVAMTTPSTLISVSKYNSSIKATGIAREMADFKSVAEKI